MNFKRKPKNDPDWKSTGSFVRKPAKGWIHPDHLLETSSVIYETQYIGAVKVLESVKSIPFEERGFLVREAIRRCCYASKLYELKKKKNPAHNERLGEIYLNHCGALTSTTFSKSFIRTFILRTGEKIWDHNIQNISFASIGENEFKNFIGYVSKDRTLERGCFIFECKDEVADDIILTIGQSFELKYKEFLSCSTGIQPVCQRFTDPTNEEATYETANAPSPPNDDYTSADYSKLFGVESSTQVHESAYGYSSLNRNDNTQISNEMPSSNSLLNFTPGPLYGDKEVNFATIYDNPISSTRIENLNIQDNASIRNTPRPINNSQPSNSLIPVESETVVPLAKYKNTPCLPPSHVAHTTTVIQNATSTVPDITRKKWFHGKMSRATAEKFVKCDGDFLVRESTSSLGQYVLSGKRDGVHRHILLIDPTGKVKTRDRTFSDVPELIHFYHSKEIPIVSGNSEVYLKREVVNYSLANDD